MTYRAVVYLCFCLFFFSSSALFANDKFTVFFQNLKTLSADFEQVVENSQLSSIAKASGKLWIQRPGKFRWDYTTPYEQQIVSDGKKLWIFDTDLEQVTVKPVSVSMGNTPAVLLSDTKPVTDTFYIQEIGSRAGLYWVELKPKDSDASFTEIRLGFDATVLTEMLLEDNLGQTTQLKFTSLRRNAAIAAETFEFTPPAGVDVFETTE